MKKLSLFLFTLIATASSFAQDLRKGTHIDYPIPRFSVELNGMMGTLSNERTTQSNIGSYLQPAVYYGSTLKSTNWKFKAGGDAEFAYFLGLKHHFGIGMGVMYSNTTGNLNLDSFRVEYKEKDSRNNDFRQLVTIRNIKESITTTNISIPVVANYKVNISKRITLSVDAGILVNMVASGKYNADATADFEAIYKFNSNGTTAYDSAAIPANSDWRITKNLYSQTHTANTVKTYFDSLHTIGYNVALDVHPNSKSGRVNNTPGSIGFLIRPAIAYNFTQKISVTIGGYFMSQTIKNTAKNDYRIMDINGNYASVLNMSTSLKSTSYGINLGVRYSFGW